VGGATYPMLVSIGCVVLWVRGGGWFWGFGWCPPARFLPSSLLSVLHGLRFILGGCFWWCPIGGCYGFFFSFFACCFVLVSLALPVLVCVCVSSYLYFQVNSLLLFI